MNILFVVSEFSPLVSTGGLAEVAAALPAALHARGHDVRVAIPCYRQIEPDFRGEEIASCMVEMGTHTEAGVLRRADVPDLEFSLYLVQHEGYFGRDHPYGSSEFEYNDNVDRFCFFCLAILETIPKIGWKPDVIHCHDWHTAAMPIFLRTRYADNSYWQNSKTVFTIHNMAFQGRYHATRLPHSGLDPSLFDDGILQHHGDMNLMKGALHYADSITTVSARYAHEIQMPEYGEGLDAVLRGRAEDLSGLLNGVDYSAWNPAADPFLPACYTADELDGKLACKHALQKVLGFEQKDFPLFGIVSRLYWQKGIDLLLKALPHLQEYPLQLVVLGTGDPELEAQLRELEASSPHRVAVRLKYDATLAHLIQAGSDFFLMPSRYEPCGLGQMYSLAYGAVPVVRRTGGLADTIHDINAVYETRGIANGISFVPKTSGALARAMQRAVALYAKPEQFRAVQRRGMQQDFSWDVSCQRYEALFSELTAPAVAM